MGDEVRRQRFEELCAADRQDALSEAERAELQDLIEERCHREEEAVAETARRIEESNSALEAQVNQVEAQNRELEALIREQEAYVAEVQSAISRMEAQRQNWRERYEKLTGRPLGEPATTPGS